MLGHTEQENIKKNGPFPPPKQLAQPEAGRKSPDGSYKGFPF